METIYDGSLPVLERIKVPMVWARLDCGVRVQDLQEDRYEDALQIAKDFFIEDDPMCAGCKLNTEENSIQEFLDLVQLYMQDTQSFLAVDDSGEAVGVLVGRVNDHNTKIMSRMKIVKSEGLGKMQRFQAHIDRQVDLFEQFRTEAYYKVYLWCVSREYRNKGIGKALLRTAIRQTHLFKMPVVSGVFTGAVSQHVASTMDFLSLVEILYWQWKEADVPVLDNPGAGNNSAQLMVYVLPENLTPSTPPDQEIQEIMDHP